MSKQQWTIIGVLGIAVVCLYCIVGLAVLWALRAPSVISNLVAQVESPISAIASPTLTTSTRTSTPTASPTATWVLASPPTSANATAVGTPILTPGVTPRTMATRSTPPQSVEPLIAAWSKTQTAQTYRVEVKVTMTGNLSDLPPAWQTVQGVPMLGFTAAVNGQDVHLKIYGLLAMLFTSNPTQAFEILKVGNKTYIHGPAPLFGAPEARWYVTTGQSDLAFNPNEMLESPDNPTIDWAGFQKTITEMLDGRRCDVYVGDQNAMTKLLDAVKMRGGQNKNTLDNIISASTKLWACDDGYLHQIWANLEGRTSAQSSEKVGLEMYVHIWDYNARIQLTPPSDAEPLQGLFNFSMATPTRTR